MEPHDGDHCGDSEHSSGENMSRFARIRSRMRSWFRAASHRPQLECEMDEELAFHLDCRTQELIRRGVDPEEAARQARIELGNTLVQKGRMRASLGLRLWDDLRADLRYAARMLAKAPGFTAIAVVSLALGIGANTLIFTYTKSLLLDKLAVPHPDSLRLLMLEEGNHSVMRGVFDGFMTTDKKGRMISSSFTYPVYEFLRAHNRSMEELFGFLRFGR